MLILHLFLNLRASIKSPLCLITASSNLYSLEILSLLFLILSTIVFFSFLSTLFINLSTNAANV